MPGFYRNDDLMLHLQVSQRVRLRDEPCRRTVQVAERSSGWIPSLMTSFFADLLMSELTGIHIAQTRGQCIHSAFSTTL
jgi:hypothetical protein